MSGSAEHQGPEEGRHRHAQTSTQCNYLRLRCFVRLMCACLLFHWPTVAQGHFKAERSEQNRQTKASAAVKMAETFEPAFSDLTNELRRLIFEARLKQKEVSREVLTSWLVRSIESDAPRGVAYQAVATRRARAGIGVRRGRTAERCQISPPQLRS